MAWYAYCIAEQKAFLNGTRARRPFSIPSITGIAGTPVFGYPSGEFAVIVSNYTEGTLDQKAALDHARVVGECFRTSTVLPFRFGTVFQTEDAIRRAVRTNRKALVDSVNHLRGKAEMHLKLVVRDGVAKETIHAIAATIGGAYLTQIRERAAIQRDRQTKAKSLSVQVHRLFNPLDEEVSCKKVEAGGLLIDIAHLIDNASIEKYQNRYVAAARQLKDCQIALSGPWPPYHFMPGKLKSAGNS